VDQATATALIDLVFKGLAAILAIVLTYYGGAAVRVILAAISAPQQRAQAELVVRAAEQLLPGQGDAKYRYAAEALAKQFPTLRGNEVALQALIEGSVQALRVGVDAGLVAMPPVGTAPTAEPVAVAPVKVARRKAAAPAAK